MITDHRLHFLNVIEKRQDIALHHRLPLTAYRSPLTVPEQPMAQASGCRRTAYRLPNLITISEKEAKILRKPPTYRPPLTAYKI
jgi:hypothetical protein